MMSEMASDTTMMNKMASDTTVINKMVTDTTMMSKMASDIPTIAENTIQDIVYTRPETLHQKIKEKVETFQSLCEENLSNLNCNKIPVNWLEDVNANVGRVRERGGREVGLGERGGGEAGLGERGSGGMEVGGRERGGVEVGEGERGGVEVEGGRRRREGEEIIQETVRNCQADPEALHGECVNLSCLDTQVI